MNENQVTIFTNEEFGNVRTIMIDGEAWFVGKEIAGCLGYADTKDAIRKHVDDEDKQLIQKGQIATLEIPNRGMTFINESGMYSLILGSKLPSAKKFKRWITSEVLPQLRQTGSYSMTKQDSYMIEDPIERAKRWIEEQEEKKMLEKENKKLLQDTKIQQQVIGELQPKADYTDIILKSNSSMNVSQIAKDYGMSAKKLNSLLHDLGVQYKSNGQWLLYSNFHDKGYTKSETGTYDNGNQTYVHTKWTQKGRLFLYELLKKNDVLPIIEQ